jgi:predicted nucleotidyltransferase
VIAAKLLRRDEMIAQLSAEREQLIRLGVASLRLFGSWARDEATPRSDADFVVRFDGQPDFDRYMALKFHLEDVLGVKVDLVTEDALRPELREAIERDAIRVA